MVHTKGSCSHDSPIPSPSNLSIAPPVEAMWKPHVRQGRNNWPLKNKRGSMRNNFCILHDRPDKKKKNRRQEVNAATTARLQEQRFRQQVQSPNKQAQKMHS